MGVQQSRPLSALPSLREGVPVGPDSQYSLELVAKVFFSLNIITNFDINISRPMVKDFDISFS